MLGQVKDRGAAPILMRIRSSDLHSPILFLGIAGLIVSVLLSIGVVFYASQHPVGFTDPTSWHTAFAVFTVLAAALAFVGRGRWLAALSAAAMLLFVWITVVWAGTGPAFLALGCILLASASLGDRILTIFTPRLCATVLERLVFSVCIGWGGIAFLVLMLGLLHLLYPATGYALVALLLLVSFPSLHRGARYVRDKLIPQIQEQWASGDLRFPALVASWAMLSVWQGLVWSLAPSLHFDALMYHLSAPAIYVQSHAIVPIASEFRTYWAHNAEMLYTLGMLLTGQPLPALLHWTSSLLLASLTYSAGKRFGGSAVGMLAALVFLSIPLVIWESGTAYVDLFAALYAAGAMVPLLLAVQTRDKGWLIVSGIMAGMAVGTKLNSAVFLVPVGIAIAVYALWPRRGPGESLRVLLRFGIPALAFALPWWVRDWAWTGNPIFPFLNGVFASPLFVGENTNFDFGRFGVGYSPLDLLQLPLMLVIHSEVFSLSAPAQLAGVPLLALPWLYASRRYPNRRLTFALLALVAGCFIFWFRIVQYLRYLIPILPALSILVALNFGALWSELSLSRHRLLLGGAALLVGLTYFTGSAWANIAGYWEIPERIPLSTAVGAETASSFLARNSPLYEGIQFLNRIGDDKLKVGLVGLMMTPYANFERVQISRSPWVPDNFLVVESGRQLADHLAAEQFDYLMLSQSSLLQPGKEFDFPLVKQAYLDEYAQLEYARGDIRIYNLHPKPLPAKNMLLNSSFENLGWNNFPNKWSAEGQPLVNDDEAKAHSGITAVRLDRESYLWQRLTVEPDKLYTFGCWVRADLTKEFAQIVLRSQGASGRRLDVQSTFPVPSEWEWHQVSLSVSEDTIMADAVIRVSGDSEVWYDDCRFAAGPR